MKKLLSIIISICLIVTGLPLVAVAADEPSCCSLEDFIVQVRELQQQYDTEYRGEIVFEDGSGFYSVDGENIPIENENGDFVNAVVTQDGISVPDCVLEENSAEYEIAGFSGIGENGVKKAKQYSSAASEKSYYEELGYEVEIDGDTAVLTQPYQTHRLIVKSKYNIDPLDSVAIVEGYNDLHIVQFDDIESTVAALEYYEAQRKIEYAEPEIIMSIDEYDDSGFEDNSVSADSYGNHLSWGSEYIGVDDYIDFIGNVAALPAITVGIVDTGIELTHEFLQGRIIQTGFNVSGSGDADSENDDKGHGTHVAGIVVDNTTDNVKIKGYKVLNSQGKETNLNVSLGIDQAASDGVNVINMSLGGQGNDETMHASVQNAIANGVIVCVSAGNSCDNAANYSPAGFAECITVAALREDGKKAPFSNWGMIIDIIAPGVAINSSYIGNIYKSLSGTSMSCPFVSAATALLLSNDPTLDTDGVMALFEEHKRTDWENPWYMYGCPALYIGDLTKIITERTARPYFSEAGGDFSGTLEIEILCDDDADIWYTTDGSRATEESGTLYTQPLILDKTTTLHAVAKSDNKLISLQAYATYTCVSTEPESTFVINQSGIITKYNGKDTNIIIPDTVDDIVVTGIGSSVFKNYYLQSIVLPDTVVSIGTSAFEQCPLLRSVVGRNIKNIGNKAFYYCTNLTEFDFSTVETVGDSSFQKCEGFTVIENDKITTVGQKTFYSMPNLKIIRLTNAVNLGLWAIRDCDSLEVIDLPKVETLGKGALSSNPLVEHLEFPCLKTLDSGGDQFSGDLSLKTLIAPQLEGALPSNFIRQTEITSLVFPNVTSIAKNAFYANLLEMLYLPNLLSIDNGAFYWTSSSSGTPLTIIFAPKLQKLYGLPKSDDIRLYGSSSLIEYASDSYFANKNLTVIVPGDSIAYCWAPLVGATTVDSYSMISNVNTGTRAYDSSILFDYSWEEINELSELAESVTYGFEYTYNGYSYTPEAVNRVYNADSETSTFNLTISNIPNDYKNSQIKARAVINIDGMLFKSAEQIVSYNTINCIDGFVLGDINSDGLINASDYELIGQHIAGLIDFSSGEYAAANGSNNYDFTTAQFVDKTVEFIAADVNNDGAVDAFDLFKIDKMINRMV